MGPRGEDDIPEGPAVLCVGKPPPQVQRRPHSAFRPCSSRELSPQVRGAGHPVRRGRHCPGAIPATAGSRNPRPGGWTGRQDHPRACGEQTSLTCIFTAAETRFRRLSQIPANSTHANLRLPRVEANRHLDLLAREQQRRPNDSRTSADHPVSQAGPTHRSPGASTPVTSMAPSPGRTTRAPATPYSAANFARRSGIPATLLASVPQSRLCPLPHTSTNPRTISHRAPCRPARARRVRHAGPRPQHSPTGQGPHHRAQLMRPEGQPRTPD